jgi:hypothetical protein
MTMKLAYYETGTGMIPNHGYVEVRFGEEETDVVAKAGGKAARLIAVFTHEAEAKERLTQDTDPAGDVATKGQTFF